jgi:hypothetical protein
VRCRTRTRCLWGASFTFPRSTACSGSSWTLRPSRGGRCTARKVSVERGGQLVADLERVGCLPASNDRVDRNVRFPSAPRISPPPTKNSCFRADKLEKDTEVELTKAIEAQLADDPAFRILSEQVFSSPKSCKRDIGRRFARCDG